MKIDFTNKNVLITGGSRGIGRACARLFAEMNANVIITYKSNLIEAEQTLEELNPDQEHSMYQLNVEDADDVEEVFDGIIEKYGRIDVLVNNAGVFIEHKINSVSYTEWQQSWRQTIDTNLIGPANLCYLAAGNMIEHGGGKIINISSRGAFRGEPDHPAYGASKAALNAMSQSLAVALAPHGISVGVIAPGFVATDMAADILNSAAGGAIKNQSPFNRVAEPEEVARLVAMFASQGFEFTSGAIIDINGASYLRT